MRGVLRCHRATGYQDDCWRSRSEEPRMLRGASRAAPKLTAASGSDERLSAPLSLRCTIIRQHKNELLSSRVFTLLCFCSRYWSQSKQFFVGYKPVQYVPVALQRCLKLIKLSPACVKVKKPSF